MPVYVGIDLALPGKRRIGFASINTEASNYYTKTLSNYDEIINETVLNNPKAVCIDSPLSLPKEGINRLIEINARKMGLKLLPPLMGAMRELTMFGIEIANKLRDARYLVLEVHPTSTLKILGIGNDEFLRKIRKKLIGNMPSNKHEVDALVASYTCYLHDVKCTESIMGYEEEGQLIIPRRDCDDKLLNE